MKIVMNHKLEIDATGLLCPLPVLKLRKRMESILSGSIIKIITDDPAAIIDIPHFCNENNHFLISSKPMGTNKLNKSVHEYFIRKG
jgi:tRNA 2-thiouridine synthesizing protein A